MPVSGINAGVLFCLVISEVGGGVPAGMPPYFYSVIGYAEASPRAIFSREMCCPAPFKPVSAGFLVALG